MAQVWGETGLENIFDTIMATGSRRVHFRSHCAGPWWPTKIEDASPGSVGIPLKPSFEEWNPVTEAVKVAHRKGLKIIGWFDLTEGHAGLPTMWALKHPQFCIVNRGGIRLDGPTKLVGHSGTPFDPDRHITYRDFIEAGLMDHDCARPDGTTIDPQLSLAYPEVIEYRLALLRELISFGVDGIFLTANACVGYEDPVADGFEREHGIPLREVAEDDPRWIGHQQCYFTDFMRKVHRLVREEERLSGRKLELILEGQGTDSGHQEPEPGWSRIPNWVLMPHFIDLETIARERLVDTVSFWTLRQIDKLKPEIRQELRIAMRYRYTDDVFTRADYNIRLREAEKRGVSLFIINEPRTPLLRFSWLYPGEPGPLYQLVESLTQEPELSGVRKSR